MSVRCQLSPGATGIPAATGSGGEGSPRGWAGEGTAGAGGRGGAGLPGWSPRAALTGGAGISEPLGVARRGDRLRPCGGSSAAVQVSRFSSGSRTPATPRLDLQSTSLGLRARETHPKARWKWKAAATCLPAVGLCCWMVLCSQVLFASSSLRMFFFLYFIKVIRVFLYFKSISSRRMFNNNKTGFLPSAPHPVTVPCSPPQKQRNHCPLLGLLLAFACF